MRDHKLIYLCENDGFCTADCELRSICKKQRIPLLIHAVVVDYKNGEIYPDEYINEIALLKQKLIDEAKKKPCHQSGSIINILKPAKIKITSV